MKGGEKERSCAILFPPLLIPFGSTMEAKKWPLVCSHYDWCHFDFVGNAPNLPLKKREREVLFPR